MPRITLPPLGSCSESGLYALLSAFSLTIFHWTTIPTETLNRPKKQKAADKSISGFAADCIVYPP